MSWNQPRHVIIPWLETLAKLLGQAAMATITGRTLWVLTDYSFDNPASDFDVVGLLIVDPEHSSDWMHLRNEVVLPLLGASWQENGSEAGHQFLDLADRVPHNVPPSVQI